MAARRTARPSAVVLRGHPWLDGCTGYDFESKPHLIHTPDLPTRGTLALGEQGDALTTQSRGSSLNM